MTEAIENAVDNICQVLRAVTGLKSVPVNPPESVSYETFAIVYPFSGSLDIGPIGSRKSLNNIAIDVLTKRTDLARNFQTLKPLLDTVQDALLSEVSTGGTIFNNSINTFASISYNWTTSDYGGVPVVGYHFLMIDVKILVNL